MPIRKSQLLAIVRELDIPVEEADASIHLTYRPAAYTQRWRYEMVSRLNAVAALRTSDQLDQDAVARAEESVDDHLRSLITSWDLQRDDGSEYPVGYDALNEMGFAATLIWEAIQEDARPKRSSSPTSNSI